MSIFVDEKTKVVYQGLTGSQGTFYGLRNQAYGTQVVAGTNPKKAGTDVEGIPVFASVGDAVDATGATASCIFIPAPGVAAAVMEAAEGGVELIVVITEGVPAHDEARFYNQLKRSYPQVRLLGPNCPGIISPGKCNIGITAGEIAMGGGPVGIVSRSGTLTYQALHELTQKGIGQTTCVGIGGDPVPGTTFIDCLEAFEADPDTKAVMMIGEIGGSAEEEAAEFIQTMSKPVSAYVAHLLAGGRQGHRRREDRRPGGCGRTGGAQPDRGGRAHGRDRQRPVGPVGQVARPPAHPAVIPAAEGRDSGRQGGRGPSARWCGGARASRRGTAHGRGVGYSTSVSSMVAPPVAKVGTSAAAAAPSGEPMPAPKAAMSSNHSWAIR